MVAAKAEILDAISNMTVLELSHLIKDLEEKFGVSAAAADTPNFSSRSLIRLESSNTDMLEIASRISAFATDISFLLNQCSFR